MRAAAPLQVKRGAGRDRGARCVRGSAHPAGRLRRAAVWNANLGGVRERKRLGIRSEKEVGAIGICSKRRKDREWGWVGVLLSLNLHLLHGSHDLR